MLQQNAGLEEGLGGIQWELAGCLLLAWICVYLIIWKGLHSSGKVKFLLLMFQLDINKVTSQGTIPILRQHIFEKFLTHPPTTIDIFVPV